MELAEFIRQLTQLKQLLDANGQTSVPVCYEKVAIQQITVGTTVGTSDIQVILKG